MEKRQNCFNFMFYKCESKKCPYGHVILNKKEEYLQKLKNFDIEVLDRTSQTYGLLFVLKTLNANSRKDDLNAEDVKAVAEILEKYKNSGSSFFHVESKKSEPEETNFDSDEEEFRKWEIENKYSQTSGIQTYP